MEDLTDTIAELVAWREGLGHAPRTIECLRNHLNAFRRFLATTSGISEASRIGPSHLHAYAHYLVAKTRPDGVPMAAGSINNCIKAVRSLLEFLHRNGRLSRDLRPDLPYVKEPRVLPTSVLNHQQARKILDAVSTGSPVGFRDRAVLELLYTSGMRAGELVGLTVDDLRLHDRTARVVGKGRKERVVPVGRTAARFLEGYLMAVRPAWPGADATRALFLNQAARPLTWQNLRLIIARHCRCGDIVITAHTFRRSCTTELVRANANLYHIKELLGHESVDTLKPYTKLTILDLRKTHARFHPRERDE